MDIRYQPGQPLKVSLLASREQVDGHIENLRGRVATIILERPVAAGAALRMDFDDCMILGEVWSSESDGRGYSITLEVRDAIPRVSDLNRLVSAVMAGGRGAVVEERPLARSATA